MVIEIRNWESGKMKLELCSVCGEQLVLRGDEMLSDMHEECRHNLECKLAEIFERRARISEKRKQKQKRDFTRNIILLLKKNVKKILASS